MLTLTGFSRDAAMFQAPLALTGDGFTAREAELENYRSARCFPNTFLMGIGDYAPVTATRRSTLVLTCIGVGRTQEGAV